MDIRRHYLQPYLHDIAVNQLADDYKTKGYTVSKEEHIGGRHRADLIARKDNEVIVVEVKTGRMTPEKRIQLTQLADYVRQQTNHKFLVVIANPGKEKKIEIPAIDRLLLDYFRHAGKRRLDGLPDDATPTDVSEVNIDEVLMNETGTMTLKGTGTMIVEHPATKNDALHTVEEDELLFGFDLTLNHDVTGSLTIEQVNNLSIDEAYV